VPVAHALVVKNPDGTYSVQVTHRQGNVTEVNFPNIAFAHAMAESYAGFLNGIYKIENLVKPAETDAGKAVAAVESEAGNIVSAAKSEAVKVATVAKADAELVKVEAENVLAVAKAEAQQIGAEAKTLLADAKAEAKKLLADAKAEIAKLRNKPAPTPVVPTTTAKAAPATEEEDDL
jgi:vacuolar-type H+-ATPase subunit H